MMMRRTLNRSIKGMRRRIGEQDSNGGYSLTLTLRIFVQLI